MKKMRKVLGVLLVCFMVLSSGVFGGKVVNAAVPVTWSPSNKAESAVLSNNNLSAMCSSSNPNAAVATVGKSAGKYYWEITINDGTNQPLIGVCLSPYNAATDDSCGSKSWIYAGLDGRIDHNNINPDYGSTYSVNDVIGVALDTDNKTLIFYKNGVSQGVAYNNLPDGTYYPLVSNGSVHSSSYYTANFGATQFKYSLPSGYSPYDGNENIAVTSISVDKTKMNLTVGQTDTVTATVYPDNATNKTITWTSSDTSIATVDQTGKVTGVKAGTAIITATTVDGGKTATCTVNVTDKNPTLNIIASKKKVKVGEEFTTDAVFQNVSNIYAEDFKVNYDSTKFTYEGFDQVAGYKVYNTPTDNNGTLRFVVASQGKNNVINGDKVVLKLKFKAKAVGVGKVDALKARIADTDKEYDIDDVNCLEDSITVEGGQDVNRTGEYTLLDLAIDGFYFGEPATSTDTTKYDADQDSNGTVEDADLTYIVQQMLNNTNYTPNK